MTSGRPKIQLGTDEPRKGLQFCPSLINAEIPGDAACPWNSQHQPPRRNIAAAKIQLSPEEWKKIEAAG
jgi:hypothetical protein